MLRNKDSHDSMLWKELATLTCGEARAKEERKRKRETTDDLIGGDEGYFSQSSSVGAGGKAAAVNASPPISPEDESMVPPDARVAFYNLIRYITSLQWVSEENHGNETVKAKSEDVLPDRIRRDLSAHPIIARLAVRTPSYEASLLGILVELNEKYHAQAIEALRLVIEANPDALLWKPKLYFGKNKEPPPPKTKREAIKYPFTNLSIFSKIADSETYCLSLIPWILKNDSSIPEKLCKGEQLRRSSHLRWLEFWGADCMYTKEQYGKEALELCDYYRKRPEMLRDKILRGAHPAHFFFREADLFGAEFCQWALDMYPEALKVRLTGRAKDSIYDEAVYRINHLFWNENATDEKIKPSIQVLRYMLTNYSQQCRKLSLFRAGGRMQLGPTYDRDIFKKFSIFLKRYDCFCNDRDECIMPDGTFMKQIIPLVEQESKVAEERVPLAKANILIEKADPDGANFPEFLEVYSKWSRARLNIKVQEAPRVVTIRKQLKDIREACGREDED